MKQEKNSQTAYQHNATSSVSSSDAKDHGWCDAINRMIDQRYAFLDSQYENHGYLFRGMSSGLFDALFAGEFWHYSDEDNGSSFEEELNVLLMSQDFSDALTVSELWNGSLDACIVIFKSDIFNQALTEKKAAMMATAEPGVVFKYPFLTEPLSLNSIDALIVSPDLFAAIENREEHDKLKELSDSKFKTLSTIINNLKTTGKCFSIETKNNQFERTYLEKILLEALKRRNIVGAEAIKSAFKPKRLV